MHRLHCFLSILRLLMNGLLGLSAVVDFSGVFISEIFIITAISLSSLTFRALFVSPDYRLG